MAENRFKNDEFEDIFSSTPQRDEFEDIYSSSQNGYEDVSSDAEDDDSIYFPENTYKAPEVTNAQTSNEYKVKYNSSFENRKRQEINYDDVNEIYSDTVDDNK